MVGINIVSLSEVGSSSSTALHIQQHREEGGKEGGRKERREGESVWPYALK